MWDQQTTVKSVFLLDTLPYMAKNCISANQQVHGVLTNQTRGVLTMAWVYNLLTTMYE